MICFYMKNSLIQEKYQRVKFVIKEFLSFQKRNNFITVKRNLCTKETLNSKYFFNEKKILKKHFNFPYNFSLVKCESKI